MGIARTVALTLTACALFATTTVSAQVSESTEDWPAWQKASVGSLGAMSLLATISMIGASANDGDADGDDGSDTDSGNTVSDSGDGSDSGGSDSGGSDSGDSNSGDSNSGGSNSGDSNSDGSDSGDSNTSDSNSGGSDSGNSSDSNANARKGQGYVEELKDELLLLVNLDGYAGYDGASVDSLARDYPVLASYYRELIEEHPEVINAANETIAGATLVERLNRLMLVHLFGEAR